jgi:hypothetical protein
MHLTGGRIVAVRNFDPEVAVSILEVTGSYFVPEADNPGQCFSRVSTVHSGN